MQILTYPKLAISPKLLAYTIGSKSKEKITVATHANDIKETFIRYGNSAPVTSGLDLETNSLQFIRMAGSKLSFSNLLQANKFYCPIFYNGNVAPVSEFYPVIIRSTMMGKGGEGIILVHNNDEFYKHNRLHYHWTPYIKTEFELRVHIADGKILRIFKKIFSGDYEELDYPIRNMQNGFHFSLRENIDDYPKMEELVSRLWQIPIFKGQFLALDVGWDKEKKEYFIFEGNTSPGLNDNTAEKYADFIIEKLDL